MSMRCKNCNEDLTSFPKDSVEDGRLDKVVAFTKADKSDQTATISRTDYFCNEHCFVEYYGGENHLIDPNKEAK